MPHTPHKSLILLALAAATAASWAEVPLVSPGDLRVRYIPYRADAAVSLKVRRGVVTRVVLERDEKIQVTGTGFPSNCETASDEWCIRAMEGEHQIWIKPKSLATHNNVEVQTNKRDYSLKLEVLPDAPKGEAPPDEMFRVMFIYPTQRQGAASDARFTAPAPRATSPRPVTLPSAGNLSDLGCEKPRQVVNAKYSREAGNGMIEPLRIFDDGAHTVFVFGDAAPIPTVYAIDQNDTETRVNFTMEGNCLAVHQLSPKFVLRAGTDSIKVFNEAFSAVRPSPRLREIRENRAGEQ